MLQAGFGETDVAAPAQAAAANRLCVRALDPGTGSEAFLKRLGLLVLARALQCFEVLARLHSDDTRLALGPSAARAQRAREAVPGREPRIEYHVVLRGGAR